MPSVFVVDIPRNTWVDLYTSTGIAVGTRLIVENIGSADIRLATQATEPSKYNEIFNVLQRENGVRLSNTEGDSGAWGFAYSDSKLLVMTEDVDSGFSPATKTTSTTVATTATTADNLDAFGRLRVSDSLTLFDSKQIHDNQPLYWDDQQVSGAGTTSVHSSARASSTMGVSATTAGKRVRRTFQRFNYQPGKSTLILMTGVMQATGGGSGITTAIGYFDDANGVFVTTIDGTPSMCVRSSVTGSPVDNAVAQSAWNGDKLDGTGVSGITIDLSKSQIWWADLEWLGVGTVRTGFVIDGAFVLCHTFNHANSIAGVYMSTPNLPCCYEIENDGTGGASTLEHICSTVITEGGQQAQGQLHYATTDDAAVAVASGNTVGLIGVRLKSAYFDQQVDLTTASIINTNKNEFEWRLYFNPTVAGTFTFADHPNSSVQLAIGTSANTITGGIIIGGGVNAGATQGSTAEAELKNALRLGSTIAGVSDVIVLAVKAYNTGETFDASLGWRELS